jgi:septal ring factor EnvC (AmiA/AmiB activator)
MGMRAVLAGLLALCGVATVYGLYERNQVQQLRSEAAATNNSVSQLQAQLNTLTAKLNSEQPPPAVASTTPAESSAVSTPAPAVMEAEPATAPATPAPAGAANSPVLAPKPAAKHPAAKRRSTAADKRYSQLKSQLDDQQKQLRDAQDQIAKNRADLEGSINSTRDELNGSIAKSHEELVALEKRGERSYFEFDLTKSKQFQRYGPVTISLRKVDTKHKNYDLAMIVDDNELNKKKVNLYEPIWIHTENGAQPIQVVVNRVEKNLVHGYVSAPKYKQSELAALSTSTNSSAAPASNDPSQGTAPTQPQ